MTLLELRRYAIRNRMRVRFTLDAGTECVVNEHGVVKIPSLRSAPAFNVEASLASIEQFVLDPAEQGGRPQTVSRQALQARLGDAAKPEQSHEE